jgi:hypothetical protein
MLEQTQPKYEGPQGDPEADLANMGAALAAPLRRLGANIEAKTAEQAERGAEKWEAIKGRLQELIDDVRFVNWFKDVKPAFTPATGQRPPHLRLAFSSCFLRDHVEANCGDMIRGIWQHMERGGTLELAIQPAEDRAALPAKVGTPAKPGKILPFPVFPTEARPVVNEIARSGLFAAIQGKDRQLVKDALVVASGDSQMFFTGEQFNQDDLDVLMQLAAYASGRPAGEYIPVTGHSLLKALGRDTGGTQHKQLDSEIKRLTAGLVEIKNARYTYLGHLIDDAVKDEKTKAWVYRLNEKLRQLYEGHNYTLIDWEQRKKLKGKDLARWLQAFYATHAEPYPMKVETLWRLSGSKNASLRGFRRDLKKALTVVQDEGHIKAWRIDERDLVQVDRGNAISASQQRRLEAPQPR